MKKILSFVLMLALIVSLFAGMTVTASADYTGSGTFTKTSGELASGYYVFAYDAGTALKPMSNDTGSKNWIKPGEDISSGDSIENPVASVVWYFDASAGTLNSAGDSTLYVCWSNSGSNSAMPTTTATPLTITDTGDGVYNVAVSDTPDRVLRYNTQSSGWRFYTSSTGSAAFAVYKLSDGTEPPAHVHDWGEWTSNGDGTHSRRCQDEACPGGGLQSQNCTYEDQTVTPPTCVDEGELEHTCTVCGYSYTETLPATGEHTDANEDGVCDVCGEAMPTATVFTLGTELHEGDRVVIYYPNGSLALSANASGAKLAGTSASISGEELSVLSNDTATAVMTVEFDGATNFMLKTADGKYLTTPAAGNGLSFADEADDYSLWYLQIADASAKTVYIRSVNAAYNGNKNQAMEYFSGFTVYSFKTTDIYKFQLYILANPDAHVHEWDEGTVTTEATCTANGVKTYSCSGCGETYTEEIPMIAHADENEDGLCDLCSGLIFAEAAELNDGDSLILVSTNYGRAMTGTASGTYMASAEVNAQAGVTVPAAEDNVWTVTVCDTGFYLINSEGQYLYVNSSNKLALGDETNDNRVWKIADPVEGLTATGAYLVNEGGRYLEYSENYKNYQTFSAPTEKYEKLYAFTFYTRPAEKEPLEDGFYLIGSQFEWSVDNLTAEQKFELNEETGEYVLKTALNAGDEIKVVRVENGAIAENGWYGNFNYEVDELHAGPEKSIFFKPEYNDGWSQFGGYIWINANATAKVYGASLTLDGKIGLNFYLTDLPGDLLNNSSFVTLDVAGLDEENSQSLKLDIKNAATEEQDGKTLYKFSVKLAPKQMKDAVTLKVFDNAGDPVLLSNNAGEAFWEYAYTVQDYIGKVIDKAEDSNLVALVKAMSDFGSLAQIQFGYGEAEALYNEDAVNAVTQGDLEKYKATITNGKATGATSEGKSNLVLESATVLNIYFTLDEGEEIENFTFKRGSTKVEPTQYDGSTYYVQVPNTAAKNLDRYNTLTIYKNGTKVLTEKCSALSYCYRVLDPESGAQVSMQNLAKGLYLYNLAADAYFN